MTSFMLRYPVSRLGRVVEKAKPTRDGNIASEVYYMKYSILDESEFDDFYAAIRDHGQQPEDFELTERVTGLEKGVATVRRKKSGVERSYPIGNGTIFPADFAGELGQGLFV